MEINALLVVFILLATLITLILAGVYIAFAMLLTGLLALLVFSPGLRTSIGFHLFNSINSFVLVAVPLFLFMGQIVLRSGITKQLYDGVSKITGVVPGGLLHSNIVACSIFAAVSGSATATCATIGGVAIPEQIRRKYDRKLVMGSLLCGGTLGVLIPPSCIMIIYGAFCKVSVARLFLGGFLPGFLIAGLFMVWIAIGCTIHPGLAPPRAKLSWAYFPRALLAFKDIWPFVVLMGFILGSIYSGLATPTEAAAVSCAIALVIAAALRRLNFKMIKDALMGTIRTNCFIMICIIGGRFLGVAVSMIKLPAVLISSISNLGISPVGVWAIMVVAYLIMGCLIEDVSLMIVTLPVSFPLMVALGFHPVWFGVMLTVLIQLAMITPPVGICLYVIQGISMGTPIEHIMLGSLPFVLIMLVAMGICTVWPEIVLVLPRLVFGV